MLDDCIIYAVPAMAEGRAIASNQPLVTNNPNCRKKRCILGGDRVKFIKINILGA